MQGLANLRDDPLDSADARLKNVDLSYLEFSGFQDYRPQREGPIVPGARSVTNRISESRKAAEGKALSIE